MAKWAGVSQIWVLLGVADVLLGLLLAPRALTEWGVVHSLASTLVFEVAHACKTRRQ